MIAFEAQTRNLIMLQLLLPPLDNKAKITQMSPLAGQLKLNDVFALKTKLLCTSTRAIAIAITRALAPGKPGP